MLNAAVASFLTYGLLNIVFEAALLGLVPPRWRLAILGLKATRTACHLLVLIANLYLHWGTLGGTTGAQASFLLSFIGIPMCMALWGWTYRAQKVKDGQLVFKDGMPVMERRHRRGVFGYHKEELRLPAWIET